MNLFIISLLNFFRYYFIIIAAILFFRCGTEVKVYDVEPAVSKKIIHESRERQDLFDENSPEELKVVQITTNPEIGSHNVYTEAQVFTPDSKRFVFVRQRNYWLCDIEDKFGLRQLTDETGTKGPSVSPDGKWLYYIIDRTSTPEKRLKLKRLSLKDFKRETILVHEGAIPGTDYVPTRFYGLSSISSDGKRLCISAFLGDGKTENAPFGLLIFDLENPSIKLVFEGKHFNNMHPQYCRSLDALLSHDVLIQHNHGSIIDLDGKTEKLVGGVGADIHVVRDDGTNWRDVPIGRDGIFRCQGHQQWLGRTGSVISDMSGQERNPIYIAKPVPTGETTSHKGSKIEGGMYIDITRNIEDPDFWHLSPDISGMHIISDTRTIDKKTDKRSIRIAIGTLSSGEKPELKVQYLLNTKTSGKGQAAHPHPFFSPDAGMAFFNSDVDGIPQIFMVTGYKFPEF